MLLLYVIATLFLAYAAVLIWYWRLWKRIPVSNPESKETISCSLVIPARNEEENIAPLLEAISRQEYPSNAYEVIVVDDHSDDNTVQVARGFEHVKVIPSTPGATIAFKKKAVETGINAAQNEWILCTDADCIPPAGWMKTMSAHAKQHGSVFLAAPVVITHPTTLLGYFQVMDFMMLQAITGAVVHHNLMSMCNGANIAYQKSVFQQVEGFKGVDDIASGDDMLLMYKIQKNFPGRVHYVKSKAAIVSTAAASTWKDFFRQRIRWASKSGRYQDKRILPILGLVYAFNLSFVFMIAAVIIDPSLWWWLVGMFVGKTLVELPLFISAAKFFNKEKTIPFFILFQPLHIFYTIISGTFSQFGKYKWKGRVVR